MDSSSPVPSPSSPSSSDGTEPSTPIESHVPLALTAKYLHPAERVGTSPQINFLEQFQQDPSQYHEPFFQIQPQEPAEVPPSYLADLVAMANKHSLLLYAVPLQPWEDRQLSGASYMEPELHWVTPSYIEPQPSQEEALGLLQALLNTANYSTSSKSAETSATPRDDLAEQLIRILSADDSSEDSRPPGDVRCVLVDEDDPKSPPVAPQPSTEAMIDSTAEEASEPEPEFYIELEPDSYFEAESPFKYQQHEQERFDPFLYSPCHCFATPLHQDSTDGSTKGRMDVRWDEGMPEVLENASQNSALNECLRIMIDHVEE